MALYHFRQYEENRTSDRVEILLYNQTIVHLNGLGYHQGHDLIHPTLLFSQKSPKCLFKGPAELFEGKGRGVKQFLTKQQR